MKSKFYIQSRTKSASSATLVIIKPLKTHLFSQNITFQRSATKKKKEKRLLMVSGECFNQKAIHKKRKLNITRSHANLQKLTYLLSVVFNSKRHCLPAKSSGVRALG